MVRSVVAVVVLVFPVVAQAGDRDQGEPEPARPTQQALSDGSFMPFVMPARVGGTQAFAAGFSGYDFSRSGPLADVVAEVRLWGPLALRGGATYSNDSRRMRPNVGARIQLLRQEAQGVDGSLSVFFRSEGFTEAEGEIETFASVARTFGNVMLVGNLVYGQDPEGNERDGEIRASIVRRTGRLVLGINSRVRSALGAQHGKAATVEPNFDAIGGPLAIAAIGPIAVSAQVGASAVRFPGLPTRAGVVAFGGVGAAF